MEEIKTISIDIETFSDIDLSKCGVYKYSESENFEILLFAYSINHGDVKVIDLALGETIPIEIITALTDNKIIKWAYNTSFERVCLSRYISRYYPGIFISYSIDEDTVNEFLDPSSWRCSMIWSAYLGLPLSLAGVGSVLGLEEQKLKECKDLIKYFCVPCNPTKTNGGRTRNLPVHDMEKWDVFKKYNKRDVEVEVSIQKRLQSYPVPEFLWDEYHLDQEINDRGIALDMKLVENAIKFDEIAKQKASEELQGLTNIENPNSVMQMKEWLNNNGVEVDSLGKKEVTEMIKDAPKEIVDVLELRQQISKSSVKKYIAMKNAGCVCNRARGMFQFYGANRTGRWAGRIIQLQHLPQNHIGDLEDARELVKYGDYNAFETLYDVPDTLSQLIRTAFVPRDGMKFIVADFSAIEARVLSFLANEKWRMDVFANNGDIYCQSASAMFKVPVEKHGVNGHLRQKGKIAELACGYGGSVGALKAMGALDMGLNEEELEPLVKSWREANPNIVAMWWAVDRSVKNAIINRTTTETHGLKFIYKSGMLFIELPSGRRLAYVKPKIGINQFGSESVTYEGVGATKKWERLESYGPKFVENIIQAISRDILCYAMQRLSYCFIVGHIHDEMIIECSKEMSLEKVCEQMGETPPWIKGLLLRADGYECEFYKKD
jgi:DNA polymerase